MTEKLSSLKKFWIALGVLFGLFMGGIALASFHLYDYTEHDPKFCISCHIMNDAYQSWETSIHQGIECHTCHYATIYEKNQMLIKAIVERPTKVSSRPHDKVIVPSTICLTCHLNGNDEAPQVSQSRGHLLHWFKGGLECTSCHAIKLHQFAPDQTFCTNCHAQQKNLPVKMKDLPCSSCHNFRTGRLLPQDQKCLDCHPQKAPVLKSEGLAPAHQPFGCNSCHQVHNPNLTPGDTCIGCHRLAVKRGKHPLHLKALGNDCVTCHQPHQWRIAKKAAASLCSQCHKNYPLKSFSKS